jgi:hypothetical protein
MIAGREGLTTCCLTHGRYDYSSITSRADYSWPRPPAGGVHRAQHRGFGFGVGKGAAIARRTRPRSHSIYSWRDYGNRVGIWRLFELLDELGLPAEAQINAAIYDTAPDILARGCAPAARDPGPRADQLGRAGHLPEAEERT